MTTLPARKWVVEFTIHGTNKEIVSAAKWAKETFYSLEECHQRILHHVKMGRFCSYTEYLA